jgi:hypothetical protein
MTDELTVITERVDDIPVLLTHMIKMGLPQLLDEQQFPLCHNFTQIEVNNQEVENRPKNRKIKMENQNERKDHSGESKQAVFRQKTHSSPGHI